MRTVACVPEHDELLDSIDHALDRRDTRAAILITSIALGLVLVASMLIVISAAGG